MAEPNDPIHAAQARWETHTLRPALEKTPERDAPFVTTSSAPVERLYTPQDLAGRD